MKAAILDWFWWWAKKSVHGRENIPGEVEIRDIATRETEEQTDAALKMFLSVYCVLMMVLQAEQGLGMW